MYFLLKMGIFQPAMLVYQRVVLLGGGEDNPKRTWREGIKFFRTYSWNLTGAACGQPAISSDSRLVLVPK